MSNPLPRAVPELVIWHTYAKQARKIKRLRHEARALQAQFSSHKLALAKLEQERQKISQQLVLAQEMLGHQETANKNLVIAMHELFRKNPS